LRINAVKQQWYCDPCGSGGDLIAFVERLNGWSFREALKFLADRGGCLTRAR
jgi:DNA primase